VPKKNTSVNPIRTPKAGRAKANRNKPKGKRGGPNSIPQAEVYRRLEVIEAAMQDGIFTTNGLIEHLVAEGFPRVAARTMRTYVKRVREQWAKERIEDRAILRDEASQRLRKYLTKLFRGVNGQTPNHSDVVNVLRELHKVEGVYAPERHDVTVHHEMDKWSDAELERFIKTGEEPVRDDAEGRTIH